MQPVAEEITHATVAGVPFRTMPSQTRKNKKTDDSKISLWYLRNIGGGARTVRTQAFGEIQRMVVHRMFEGTNYFLHSLFF